MNAVLQFTNMSFDYVDDDNVFRALNNISLTVKRGEYIAIKGASGSGKSTMLNLIGLLATPTEGDYFFDGTDIKCISDTEQALLRRNNIGFIFQNFNLLPRLTVLENVLLPILYLDNLSPERRGNFVEYAHTLLQELGIANKANSYPGEMSGGQKQRVAICRALLLSPNVILADEPTGALDAHTTQEVLDILAKLNAQGKTIIVITHDNEVAKRANRQINLKDGQIVADEITQKIVYNTEKSISLEDMDLSFVQKLFYKLQTLWQEVLFAWKSLMAHRLRSFLTGLGLLIGIISIVFVAGLGIMADRIFATLFLSPITQKVYVRFDDHHSARQGNKYWAGLSPEKDFPALAKRFSEYGIIRPSLNSSTCSVISSSKSARTRLQGLYDTTEFAELNVAVEQGRFPTSFEIESGLPVAMLGSDVISQLFADDYKGRGNADFPIGEKIYTSGCEIMQTFNIIGVLAPQDLAFMRTDANDLIYTSTFSLLQAGAEKRFRRGFSAMPKKGVSPTWLANSIANYLSLRENGKIEFDTMVPAEALSKIQTMMLILQSLTGFIGALCIVVGGVGIMNILLVSVRERIREIGLSKSLGATSKQILRQFLIEAATLCLVFGVGGAIIGFIINNIIAFIVAQVFPNLGEYSVVYAWNGIIIGLFISVLCGIGFGLLPALRASKTNPATCLRDE